MDVVEVYERKKQWQRKYVDYYLKPIFSYNYYSQADKKVQLFFECMIM